MADTTPVPPKRKTSASLVDEYLEAGPPPEGAAPTGYVPVPPPPSLQVPDVAAARFALRQAALEAGAKREGAGTDRMYAYAQEKMAPYEPPPAIPAEPTWVDQIMLAAGGQVIRDDNRPATPADRSRAFRHQVIRGLASPLEVPVKGMAALAGYDLDGSVADLVVPGVASVVPGAEQLDETDPGWNIPARFARAVSDRPDQDSLGLQAENETLAAMRVVGTAVSAAVIEAVERAPVGFEGVEVIGRAASERRLPTWSEVQEGVVQAGDVLGAEPGHNQRVDRPTFAGDYIQAVLERIERGDGFEVDVARAAETKLGPEWKDAGWYAGFTLDVLTNWEGMAGMGPKAAKALALRTKLAGEMGLKGSVFERVWTAIPNSSVDIGEIAAREFIEDLEAGRKSLADAPEALRPYLSDAAAHHTGLLPGELARNEGFAAPAVPNEPFLAATEQARGRADALLAGVDGAQRDAAQRAELAQRSSEAVEVAAGEEKRARTVLEQVLAEQGPVEQRIRDLRKQEDAEFTQAWEAYDAQRTAGDDLGLHAAQMRQQLEEARERLATVEGRYQATTGRQQVEVERKALGDEMPEFQKAVVAAETSYRTALEDVRRLANDPLPTRKVSESSPHKARLPQDVRDILGVVNRGQMMPDAALRAIEGTQSFARLSTQERALVRERLVAVGKSVTSWQTANGALTTARTRLAELDGTLDGLPPAPPARAPLDPNQPAEWWVQQELARMYGPRWRENPAARAEINATGNQSLREKWRRGVTWEGTIKAPEPQLPPPPTADDLARARAAVENLEREHADVTAALVAHSRPTRPVRTASPERKLLEAELGGMERRRRMAENEAATAKRRAEGAALTAERARVGAEEAVDLAQAAEARLGSVDPSAVPGAVYVIRNKYGDTAPEGLQPDLEVALTRFADVRHQEGDVLWRDNDRPVATWRRRSNGKAVLAPLEDLAEAEARTIGKIAESVGEVELRRAVEPAARAAGNILAEMLTPMRRYTPQTELGVAIQDAFRLWARDRLGADELKLLPNGVPVSHRDYRGIMGRVNGGLDEAFGVKGEDMQPVLAGKVVLSPDRQAAVADLARRWGLAWGPPPPKPGFERWYHGGHPPGDYKGPLWFTRSIRDARGWANRNPDPMRVWYVDAPANDPRWAGDMANGIVPLARFEMPADIADTRRVFDVDVDARAYRELMHAGIRYEGGVLSSLRSRVEGTKGFVDQVQTFLSGLTSGRRKPNALSNAIRKADALSWGAVSTAVDALFTERFSGLPERTKLLWKELRIRLERDPHEFFKEAERAVKAHRLQYGLGYHRPVDMAVVFRDLLPAYNPVTVRELDLAERILGEDAWSPGVVEDYLAELRHHHDDVLPDWLKVEGDQAKRWALAKWSQERADAADAAALDYLQSQVRATGAGKTGGTKSMDTLRSFDRQRRLEVYRELYVDGLHLGPKARAILGTVMTGLPDPGLGLGVYILALRREVLIRQTVDRLLDQGAVIRVADDAVMSHANGSSVLQDVLLDRHRTWDERAKRWVYKHPEGAVAWAEDSLRRMGMEPGALAYEGAPSHLDHVALAGTKVLVPRSLAAELQAVMGAGSIEPAAINALDEALRVWKQSALGGLIVPRPRYFVGQAMSLFPTVYSDLGASGIAGVGKQAVTNAPMVGELMRRLNTDGRPLFANRDPRAWTLRTANGEWYTVTELEEAARRWGLEDTVYSFEVGARFQQLVGREQMAARGIRAPIAWWQDTLQAVGGAADQAMRLSVYLDHVQKGLPPAKAAEVARRAVLDFRDLTEFEARWFRKVFTFYAFMRKNSDQFVRALLRHPHTITSQMRLAHYAATDRTKEEAGLLRPRDTSRLRVWTTTPVVDEAGRVSPQFRGLHWSSMPMGVGEQLNGVHLLAAPDDDAAGAVNPLIASAALMISGDWLDADVTSPRRNRVAPVMYDALHGLPVMERWGVGPWPLEADEDQLLADPDASAALNRPAVWMVGAEITDPDRRRKVQAEYQAFLQMVGSWSSNVEDIARAVGYSDPRAPLTQEQEAVAWLTGMRPMLAPLASEAQRQALTRRVREMDAARQHLTRGAGTDDAR
jgi:hypothetical protein